MLCFAREDFRNGNYWRFCKNNLKTVRTVFVALHLPDILYKKHLRFYFRKKTFSYVVYREMLPGISRAIPVRFSYHVITKTVHSIIAVLCRLAFIDFLYLISSLSAARPLKVYIGNVKRSTASRRGQLQNSSQEPVCSFDPPEFCRTRNKTHFLEQDENRIGALLLSE